MLEGKWQPPHREAPDLAPWNRYRGLVVDGEDRHGVARLCLSAREEIDGLVYAVRAVRVASTPQEVGDPEAIAS
jgi:hypothetical protein